MEEKNGRTLIYWELVHERWAQLEDYPERELEVICEDCGHEVVQGSIRP